MSRVVGNSQPIRINEGDLKRVRDVLYGYRNGAEKAVMRAVNHGTRQGRKHVVDGIYAKAALKKADIREHTSFRLASLGTMGSAQAKLILKSGPINLLKYGAKPAGKSGVSFRIWRDGKREKYRHAFIATLIKARYSGVFEVNIDSPKYKEGARTPWRRKEGPGIPTIYQQTPGLAEKANELAMEAMMKELDRQVGLIDRGLL
jgi:hypothetical protein